LVAFGCGPIAADCGLIAGRLQLIAARCALLRFVAFCKWLWLRERCVLRGKPERIFLPRISRIPRMGTGRFHAKTAKGRRSNRHERSQGSRKTNKSGRAAAHLGAVGTHMGSLEIALGSGGTHLGSLQAELEGVGIEGWAHLEPVFWENNLLPGITVRVMGRR
jgi:hypothetical protein